VKIVKFKDETYGIRDGGVWGGYIFYSPNTQRWHESSENCRIPNLGEAKEIYHKLLRNEEYITDRGKPI
jgi:hypothetical protein